MSDLDPPINELRQQVAAYAPRVFGLLVRMIGRRDVAEDLAQQTMLRALGALDRYRPEGRFQAWIFRIAVNVGRDWIRRRPREPSLGLDPASDTLPPAAVTHEAPEEALLKHERARAVEAALAKLPDADREVLLMRYYGELAFKEIAEATGQPIGTVLARAHRALKKLGDLVPGDDL